MRRSNREKVAKSSIQFFENGMSGHSAVESMTSLGQDMYILKRTQNRPDLKILVADIYIAGEADIHEIKPNLHDLDCIVLIGFYNKYSFVAEELAKSMNVGLFDNREFFGAVNLTGEKMVNYKPKPKK